MVTAPLRILPRQVVSLARRYAAVSASILITGETGVGKDALARYIHTVSPRVRHPFVVVDCPALAPTLVEAELLGHEPGAFTDARSARPGRFEQAGVGTVYLDTITSLPRSGQGALLRVLEEGCVTRLGGTHPIATPARVIASADAAVEDVVAAGLLRADLYHRLRVLPLHIPSLRERRSDIVPIARRLLAALSTQRAVPALSDAAADALTRYHWPGNIRELRHVLERTLLAVSGERIEAESLPQDILRGADLFMPSPGERPPTLDDVQRRYIALTLQLTKGNQTKAAAILGLSRKGLWDKRRRYALE